MGFSDLMGGGNDSGGGFFTHKEDGCIPNMTPTAPWGFGACFVAGGILTFIGTLAWIQVQAAFKDPGAFASHTWKYGCYAQYWVPLGL